jgi:hypothetical protein
MMRPATKTRPISNQPGITEPLFLFSFLVTNEKALWPELIEWLGHK